MPARRARIVLLSAQGRVAVIRRRRGRQEYWSFPGGGIKRGERPLRAARRELLEELHLDVRPERLLGVASGHALFLARIDDEPPLRMHGPEVRRRDDRFRYRPEWVPLDRLADLDLRPRTARLALASLRPVEPVAVARPEPAGTGAAGAGAGGAVDRPATRRRRSWLLQWHRRRRSRPRG